MRKQYPPEFKAKFESAAIKKEETISELSLRYGLHPNMVTTWKRSLFDGGSDVFDKRRKSRQKAEGQFDKLLYEIAGDQNNFNLY